MTDTKTIRVLIVEDDLSVSEMIQGALERGKYTVVGKVADGLQAIEMTQMLRPDVVLMDLELPGGIDGIEATRSICATCPTPVVALTAHETPDLVERAIAAGVGAYLIKPPNAREIERAITISLARFGDLMELRRLNTALQAEMAQRKQAELEIQRRTAQLEALHQVGLELTIELELDTLLHSIAARAIQLLEGISGGLFLYRPDRDILEWAVSVAPDPLPLGTVRQRGEGLAGKIWATGQPLIVDDYQHWEGRALNYGDYPLAAVVGAPIRWNEEFLGVLVVHVGTQRTASSADAQLLSLFAAQAAIAIQNARLFRAEQGQRALAETLREVGAALASTLDVGAVLDRLLEQVNRVVPNDVANVMLIEGDHARIARMRGYEQFGFDSHATAAAYPIARVPNLLTMVETGQPVTIPDTRIAPNWVHRSEIEWQRSYAGAPIQVRGKIIGFLNVGSATPGFFTPDHAERLRAFADQAGIALENARLFSSLTLEKEQLELLYRLGRQLAEDLDVRQVAQRALDGICAVLGAWHGVALVLDPTSSSAANGSLRLVAASGYDAESIESLDGQLQLRVGDGLAGWVAAQRQPVLVDDTTKDSRWMVVHQLDDWVHSALSVPLLSGDELVGVLSIYSDQVAYFNQEHLRLIESAAATVAVAIANARLYQAEREQHHRLQASQARLVQAEKMAALGRLVASIAHEINNPLQAVMGSLELLGEELASGSRRERLERYLGMAEKESERIAAIVRRVCDFYSPAREGRQSTDVQAALDGVLELAGRQLQNSHITVRREWTDGLPAIRANPDHLRQVFLNLVLNAIDAMAQQGGTLCIHTALDQVQGQDDQPRPAVRIEFSDTGVGIAPGALENLFEPFSTTKVDATGLGLAISYEIIQAHGGQINAISQVGAGTTFTILLPVAVP